MQKDGMPLGFGMALMQNEKAMQRFGRMTQQEKDNVIAQTSQVRSKKEMQQIVSELAE